MEKESIFAKTNVSKVEIRLVFGSKLFKILSTVWHPLLRIPTGVWCIAFNYISVISYT